MFCVIDKFSRFPEFGARRPCSSHSLKWQRPGSYSRKAKKKSGVLDFPGSKAYIPFRFPGRETVLTNPFLESLKVMDKTEVHSRVKKVTAKVLGLSVDQISDKANFVFDLGADSQQSIQLVASFEEEFDIEMDEDKALSVQTVGKAVDFIYEYVK